MQLPAHGANAAALYAAMNIEMPECIIDLSENVNSEGFPQRIAEAWSTLMEKLTDYPHEQAEPFRSIIATKHGVEASRLVVTNGAAEALMALAQLLRGKRVALIEPSFSEYRRTLTQHGCTILSVPVRDVARYEIDEVLLADALLQVDAVYICNPNNPTGVLTERVWLEAWMQRFPHCLFVVDEAFMDWTDEAESVVALTQRYDNLLVMRSMTKMYALAGVRLGYAVGQRAGELVPFLPHWNVSGLAIAIGCLCVDEDAFVKQARENSRALRLEMTRFLREIGCEVSDSQANFLLFQMPKRIEPAHFFAHLLARGIVLRHTKNYVGLDGKWFRIAVKTAEMWDVCRKEMERYVEHY